MRTVLYALFHQSIFIPRIGHLGNSLPSVNKTLPDLKMFHTPEGVRLEIKGRTFVLPWPNVVTAEIGPETAETLAKSPTA